MAVGAEREQLVDRRQLRPTGDERAGVVHLERYASSAALFAAVLGAVEHLPAEPLPGSASDAAVAGTESFVDGRVGAVGDAADGLGSSWH